MPAIGSYIGSSSASVSMTEPGVTQSSARITSDCWCMASLLSCLKGSSPGSKEEAIQHEPHLVPGRASPKCFGPKGDDNCFSNGGRNAERDFHGEKRLNETHGSRIDPDARSYRKQKRADARMAYLGDVLLENCNGPIVNAKVTVAPGAAAREAATEVTYELYRSRCRALDGDRSHGALEFKEPCRNKERHVACNPQYRASGWAAQDEHSTRHAGP